MSLSEGKSVFMYRGWFLSSSPELNQIVWIFSWERPEPMEQYVKPGSCILHEDQGRRDDPARLSLADWWLLPPQPTVIWNKSLHASHWSDCQDCTNRGLSLAAACRDLQSVSVQDFSQPARPALSALMKEQCWTFHLWARSAAGKMKGKYVAGFYFSSWI